MCRWKRCSCAGSTNGRSRSSSTRQMPAGESAMVQCHAARPGRTRLLGAKLWRFSHCTVGLPSSSAMLGDSVGQLSMSATKESFSSASAVGRWEASTPRQADTNARASGAREGGNAAYARPSERTLPVVEYCVPVSISKTVQPSDQMSMRRVDARGLSTSGAMYTGVPRRRSRWHVSPHVQLPRSASFATTAPPLRARRVLPGLMSWWLMALRCRKSRPDTMLRVSHRVAASSSLPSDRITPSRLPNSHSSKTSRRSSPAGAKSCTSSTTCGCRSMRNMRASLAPSRVSRDEILTAQMRCVVRCRTSFTLP
mmetsp:Transcript_14697/g.30417  ORF Transcript_14697/g.30417 Transcript_14697/m.30417 type:complete len:311 (-) Transcript_14697:1112-2044(-)